MKRNRSASRHSFKTIFFSAARVTLPLLVLMAGTAALPSQAQTLTSLCANGDQVDDDLNGITSNKAGIYDLNADGSKKTTSGLTGGGSGSDQGASNSDGPVIGFSGFGSGDGSGDTGMSKKGSSVLNNTFGGSSTPGGIGDPWASQGGDGGQNSSPYNGGVLQTTGGYAGYESGYSPGGFSLPGGFGGGGGSFGVHTTKSSPSFIYGDPNSIHFSSSSPSSGIGSFSALSAGGDGSGSGSTDGSIHTSQNSSSSVPEPGNIALGAGIGAFALMSLLRKKMRRAYGL